MIFNYVLALDKEVEKSKGQLIPEITNELHLGDNHFIYESKDFYVLSEIIIQQFWSSFNKMLNAKTD